MMLTKALAVVLIHQTRGVLNEALAQEIDEILSPQAYVANLFERAILKNISLQLAFFSQDMTRLLVLLGSIKLKQNEYQMAEKVLVPEQYWSGTPPNLRCV